MPQFNKRHVGKTALELTELGFGSATIAGMNGTVVTPEDARGVVSAALDAGIGYFDTAPHYGFGRSEHMVGDGLRFRREPFVLSTKVGRLLKPVRSEADRTVPNPWTEAFPFEIAYDYCYDAIMRSFEMSLQRLGLGKEAGRYWELGDAGEGCGGRVAGERIGIELDRSSRVRVQAVRGGRCNDTGRQDVHPCFEDEFTRNARGADTSSGIIGKARIAGNVPAGCA